ncbi:hypothetical protein PAPYR_11107 [Paratrimastix pyriformis]|uniref:Uncharacterized protein n=1 Tax=Paratrimastix pyriformis TaxID=342808 RepID=A0ABQ8U7E8_9EUKA|nr:hypothetical protein PAPYR_11107 [Paratrimastix pyriformis]
MGALTQANRPHPSLCTRRPGLGFITHRDGLELRPHHTSSTPRDLTAQHLRSLLSSVLDSIKQNHLILAPFFRLVMGNREARNERVSFLPVSLPLHVRTHTKTASWIILPTLTISPLSTLENGIHLHVSAKRHYKPQAQVTPGVRKGRGPGRENYWVRYVSNFSAAFEPVTPVITYITPESRKPETGSECTLWNETIFRWAGRSLNIALRASLHQPAPPANAISRWIPTYSFLPRTVSGNRKSFLRSAGILVFASHLEPSDRYVIARPFELKGMLSLIRPLSVTNTPFWDETLRSRCEEFECLFAVPARLSLSVRLVPSFTHAGLPSAPFLLSPTLYGGTVEPIGLWSPSGRLRAQLRPRCSWAPAGPVPFHCMASKWKHTINMAHLSPRECRGPPFSRIRPSTSDWLQRSPRHLSHLFDTLLVLGPRMHFQPGPLAPPPFPKTPPTAVSRIYLPLAPKVRETTPTVPLSARFVGGGAAPVLPQVGARLPPPPFAPGGRFLTLSPLFMTTWIHLATARTFGTRRSDPQSPGNTIGGLFYVVSDCFPKSDTFSSISTCFGFIALTVPCFSEVHLRECSTPASEGCVPPSAAMLQPRGQSLPPLQKGISMYFPSVLHQRESESLPLPPPLFDMPFDPISLTPAGVAQIIYSISFFKQLDPLVITPGEIHATLDQASPTPARLATSLALPPHTQSSPGMLSSPLLGGSLQGPTGATLPRRLPPLMITPPPLDAPGDFTPTSIHPAYPRMGLTLCCL